MQFASGLRLSRNRGLQLPDAAWLVVLPAKDDRLTLHRAIMRRRMEKYPADFLAHYNLGAALQSLGQHHEPIQCLETGLKMRPRRGIHAVGPISTVRQWSSAKSCNANRTIPTRGSIWLVRSPGQGDGAVAMAGFRLQIVPVPATPYTCFADAH